MVSSYAPTSRVSVLHLLTPAEVGGKEAVVPALVLGARGSKVEARVAAVVFSGPLDHPFLAPFRDAGVEVLTIAIPRRGYLQERAEVARLCRRLRPDVVHTHGYRADVLDAAIARGLGIPVVSTVHGFTGGDRRNRFYEWLQRRALRRFDAVVAVSRTLVDDLAASGVPRERLHYVQNAWYPSEPPLDRGAACRALGLGVAPNGFRVGWVGRLSAEKGPDVLVEALRQLEDLPVTVSFVGAGPLRQALETRAASVDVVDRIRWHGLVPRAGRLLRAFEAFVLTSRSEGTPIALFEAMAAEVPIIAAGVGGVPEMLSAKEALLVPPDDSHAVATALRDVFQNPAAARRRARAARGRLEREFGLAAWLRSYEAVYQTVRSKSGSRTR
ncbi:MAG: glycosyltransferase [Bacillati bacterium ANGP1]|uniref:Glycosyltransferase n=1 Tax=Candidatus Segetimicrobium genomatis TaxID=2569760 RepID=A0A537LFG7_9BACT|nr:MAG: glycosyltransferase [Terrabacteria group bacterium ANGP1]